MILAKEHLTVSLMASKSHMKNDCETALYWLNKKQELLGMITTLKLLNSHELKEKH